MIPLRDRNPTHSTPVLTYLLIAVNTAVFVYQASLSQPGMQLFVQRYGLVPAMISGHQHVGSFITPFTSMFIHGSWLHLIANMWSLYIFGDNIEDALGKPRFLLFYLLCGVAAAAAQVGIDPHSPLPMVGASGAIAGVLAAYMRLFPRARIVTLIPIFIFFTVRELPAAFFIVIWFALQLFLGLGSLQLGAAGGGGVAFFAHIGGFVAGLWLITWLRSGRNPTRGFRQPERYGYRSNP